MRVSVQQTERTEAKPSVGFAARWWAGLSPRTRRMAPVVGTGVGTIAALTYLFFNDPNVPGHFPACPTKAILGVDCPGCGSTRALYALVHGDIARAADHNILLVIMVPFLLFWYGRWAFYSWTGRERPVPSATALQWRHWGTVALLVVVVVFGVVRNFLPYLGSSA